MKITNGKGKVNLGTFLFVLAYSLFLGRVAIGNTTFVEYISIYGTMLIVVALVGLFCIGTKLALCDRYTLRALILIAVIVVVFFVGYRYSTYIDLIILLVLMIGSKNIKLEDVVKCHFIIYSTIMTIAMICALLGLIENYVIFSTLRGYRYSLGNTYPTDFAAGIYYLVLDFVYLKRKKWKTQYSIGIILISWIVYRITDANTSFVLLCCIAIMLIFMQKKWGIRILSSKPVQNVIVFSFPVLAILSIGIHYVYTVVSSPILLGLDVLLNNRLSYGHQAIQRYGLSMFGKQIEFIGAGWGTSAGSYFYVDNGYLQIALIYGIVILLVFCLGFAYVCYKNKLQQTDLTLLMILFFIAISGLLEPRFFNILYNSFIFAISIELFSKKGKRGIKKQSKYAGV